MEPFSTLIINFDTVWFLNVKNTISPVSILFNLSMHKSPIFTNCLNFYQTPTLCLYNYFNLDTGQVVS